MIPHARVTSRFAPGVLRERDRGEDVTEDDINRLEAFPPIDRRDPHAADAQDVDAA